jgi:hypothetical protein
MLSHGLRLISPAGLIRLIHGGRLESQDFCGCVNLALLGSMDLSDADISQTGPQVEAPHTGAHLQDFDAPHMRQSCVTL